jgi:serine/threonine-protein kinase HipA
MKEQTNMEVVVFLEDFIGDKSKKIGVLRVNSVRGRHVFSFEYEKNFLEEKHAFNVDPALSFSGGIQYAPQGKIFGFAQDVSPDRWGRMLIKRKEAFQARKESRTEKRLTEIDFLLGVSNSSRMGALCFKENFSLNTDSHEEYRNVNLEVPPWVRLRELEAASIAIELDEEELSPNLESWLHLLFSPGSSLASTE